MITKRPRPVQPADPDSTVQPAATDVTVTAPLDVAQLDAAILRFVRRFPNQTVDLAPLAEELGTEPARVQLAVESLARRGMVIAPFVEPGPAGGATLTAIGLRWLIDREGGSPADTPTALKPADERIRAEDEAARLPRAQVYGVSRRD